MKLAKIIPWDIIEDRYAKLFASNRGQVAKPVRMALGALLIQEKCGYSDRETVEQITENPYLQYFIGLREYQVQPPFDPSLMVHFRKRFDAETLKAINEEICRAAMEAEKKKNDDDISPNRPQAAIKLKRMKLPTQKETLLPSRYNMKTKVSSSWMPHVLLQIYAIPPTFPC